MLKKLALVGLAVVALCAPATAQYFEPFDSDAADVKINAEPDGAQTFLDYSTLGIPEAPRSRPGDAATSGLKLESNLTGVGGASGVNVLAGATPIPFAGNYRLSYDAYMSFGGTNGTTEQALWGVGSDDTDPIEARNNRGGGGTAGTWGWISGENGYGTEDAAIQEGDTELADLGDTQLFEDVPFNTAFQCDANNMPTDGSADPPNGAMAWEWVQVDVDVADNGDGTSSVGVYYNFVEFFRADVANTSASGFALLGYEDPFGTSVNDAPELTFGLFDNFHVTEDPSGVPMGVIPEAACVPEPSGIALCLLGLAFLARRR